MATREQRHQTITGLLDRNQIDSQEQLQSLLEAEGIQIAQATLSRDLEVLGYRKGERGYAASGLSRLERAQRRQLTKILKVHCQSIRTTGMMVVLLTESGKAGDVAQAIDRLSLPDVLGTVAGQDTVFIATSSPGQALDLCRHLSRWAADRI